MGEIVIVGLGPGDPALVTRAAWQALIEAETVYARTLRHPTFAGLPSEVRLVGFDDYYEQGEDFEAVYTAISAEVLRLAGENGRVVYAVPGHPAVAERTVKMIVAQAADAGHTVTLLAGISFIEPALEALSVDALPALCLVDALELATRHHPPFDPDTPALIAQVYSAALASDVKLTLMNQYPDDHPVVLLHGLSTPDAQVERLPLYEIDRSKQIAHLTALYVPPVVAEQGGSFERLQEIVAHLRAPEGCPWDREQTHQSLRQGLLEEAYEVLAALDAEDMDALREELGDLLLQVVMQTQIATEAGEFQMREVVDAISSKLVRRHPHVFGDLAVSGSRDVVKNWEQIKSEERAKKNNGQDESIFSSVPKALPALTQALTFQQRAARFHIDAQMVEEYIAKVDEEVAELKAATDANDREEELGDLLFAVVNWARWIDVDPEAALRRSNAKFKMRVDYMTQAATTRGLRLKEMAYADLEALWEEAKRHQKQHG